MSSLSPQTREILTSWSRDPVQFCADLLPGELQPREWQPDFLRQLARLRRFCLRGIRGSWKTAALARGAFWGLAQGWRVFYVSPVRSQTEHFLRELDHVWRASPRLRAMFPTWTLFSDRIETDMPFVALTTHSAETGAALLEGAHHPEGNVLALLDESKSIPADVLKSLLPMLIGPEARLVCVSTAGNGLGWFDAAFGPERDKWDAAISIGVEQAPHLRAKKLEMARLLGASDPLFLAQYENLPGGGTIGDAFFELRQLERAVGLELHGDPGEPRIWALDVARFGRDFTVLARRSAGRVFPLVSWAKADLMATTGRVIEILRAAEEKPSTIVVDAAGVGGGVADRLREEFESRGIDRFVSVEDFIGGARPPRDEEFWSNAKTYSAHVLAGMLERGTVSLPADSKLIAELASYERTVASNGKARIKDPSNRSPDRGDAVLMLWSAESVGSTAGFATASHSELPWL